MTGRKTAVLQSLRETLRQLERSEGPRGKSVPGLAFGLDELDRLWPEGGLPQAALHEVSGLAAGPPGFAAATAFAAAAVGRLAAPVLWCGRGRELYAPGLQAVGLDSRRLIVAEAHSDKDILAALEEALRHQVIGGVVGEVERVDLTASRRLQLAAEKAGAMCWLLRRPGKQTRAPQALDAPIAAASRWRIGPAPAPEVDDFHRMPAAGLWRLELTHARSGARGSWIVEAPDAQGRLHFPARLADRGAQTRAA